MASSEVCTMETGEVEENHKFCESDGMSSDIGGFLSTSCLETDEKGDPFSSESTLNFSGDSSRFDSDCILSSSLAESGSVQQTTTCDSTVSSFLSGESLANSSMLPEGSLLLYSMASSSEQKPMSTVTHFSSPSFMLVNRGEAKGGVWPVDQKVEFFSPIHLLTPVSQSHPVVIGNSSAAAFVKNVLKDVPVPPSSLSTSPSAKEPVSLPPGCVLLSPPLLPSLTLLQSGAGAGSPPWLIQLPSAVADAGPLGTQLSAVSLDTLTSVSNALSTAAPIASSARTVAPPIASSDAGASVNPASCSSCSPVPNYRSTAASVPSCSVTGAESGASSLTIDNMRDAVDSMNHCGKSSAPSLTHACSSACSSASSDDRIITCVSSSSPSSSTSWADPKACSQPIVISCMPPNAKGSKGMQQILEHFLQQNRKTETRTTAQAADNTNYEKQSSSTLPADQMAIDVGCVGASPANSEVKPQVIMVKDLKEAGEASSFTVPQLGGRSNSVVLVLRQSVSRVMDVCSHSTVSLASSGTLSLASTSGTDAGSLPLHANNGQLEHALVPDSSSGLDVASQSHDDAEEDEVDGSSVSAARVSLSGDDTEPAALTLTPTPAEQMGTVSPAVSTCTGANGTSSNINTQQCIHWMQVPPAISTSTNTGASDTNTQQCVHWMQIQLPSNSAEETGEGNSDSDTRKLIPLTVSEKLASDMCHPIIICIIQEDGETQQVNINPMELGGASVRWTESFPARASTPGSSHGGSAADVSPANPGCGGVNTKMESDSAKPRPPLQGARQQTAAESAGQGCRAWQDESPQAGSEENVCLAASTKTSLPDSKSKQFRCDLCTAVFTRLGNYTRHRKIHTLNLKEDKHFKCPYCERPFLQRCDMKRHMAIHTNEHPFHCQTCGKGYIRKSDLIVHERFHSKDRAFKCETCGRCFYQSGDLRRHKRYVHSEDSQLVWSCGHCHRKYTREVTLIRHVKTAHNDVLLQSLPANSHTDSGQTLDNRP